MKRRGRPSSGFGEGGRHERTGARSDAGSVAGTSKADRTRVGAGRSQDRSCEGPGLLPPGADRHPDFKPPASGLKKPWRSGRGCVRCEGLVLFAAGDQLAERFQIAGRSRFEALPHSAPRRAVTPSGPLSSGENRRVLAAALCSPLLLGRQRPCVSPSSAAISTEIVC
jgi:hypothetical protein